MARAQETLEYLHPNLADAWRATCNCASLSSAPCTLRPASRALAVTAFWDPLAAASFLEQAAHCSPSQKGGFCNSAPSQQTEPFTLMWGSPFIPQSSCSLPRARLKAVRSLEGSLGLAASGVACTASSQLAHPGRAAALNT